MNTEELLVCECGSSEHQMIMRFFEDAKNDTSIYVDIHLVKRSLLYRIKYAFKYIFGYKSRFGAWDEIILGEQHIEKLELIVNQMKKNKASRKQLNLFDERGNAII
jgi:histidyl-tRNA synthetase